METLDPTATETRQEGGDAGRQADSTYVRGILTGVYFLSGACSLIYQVVWFRQLKLILGNTTYATALTVSVFLAGLALGAVLIRPWADRIRRKLAVYGGMETAISVYAGLTPLLFALLDGVYVWAFRAYAPSPTLLFGMQLVTSAGVLLPPTMLMGAAFPLLSSWIVGSPALTGFRVGRLYSANVLGAVFGASLAGFFLLRWVGMAATLWVAVALNLLVAASALLLARCGDIDWRHRPFLAEETKASMPRIVGLWLFLSGFLSLGYEIVWIRTVVHLLQAEVYVFSATLAAYLLGYSVGLSLGSQLAKRLSDTRAAAGLSLQLVGLAGLLYLPILIHLYDLFGPLLSRWTPWLMAQPGYALHVFFAMILFFVPSVVMGIGFPLMLQAGETDGQTGRNVSTAYGLNTIGSVLGMSATGFVLIPAIGTQQTMFLLGSAGVLGGMIGVWYVRRRSALLVPASALLIGAATFALFPGDAYLQWINACEGRGERPVRLLEVVEGVNTTASVHQYLDDNSKVISTAGVNVAGDAHSLRQTQKVQGHVPLILHGRPRRVLTVGFGSGELTRCLDRHQIEKVTCVEIAPEMVALAKRHFPHINLGQQVEERIEIVYMDAKNFLHLTDRTFDVIMNDSIWPGFFAESSSLYTRDYFVDGKRALNEGGLYSTWLPINLPTLSLKSILRTFADVFENAVVVYPHNWPSEHLLLVGRKSPLPFRYLDSQQEYQKPLVRESLGLLNVRDVEDVFEFLLADSDSMRRHAGTTPLNTDDHPVVEFDTGRSQIRIDPNLTWRQLQSMYSDSTRYDYHRAIDFAGVSSEQREAILERLEKAQKANAHLLKHLWASGYQEKLAELNRGLEIDPANSDLLAAKAELLRQRP